MVLTGDEMRMVTQSSPLQFLSGLSNWTNFTPTNIVTPRTDSAATDQPRRFYRAPTP
jgi:hypothetical protein